MMRDFDWNLIKSFLAVIENDTLLAAANKLKISQPTIGRHITELEAETKLKLFDRGRNGMRPTDAALALAQQANEIKQQTTAFSMQVEARSANLSGTVRITASQIVANFILPEIIASFREQEPDIEVELVSSNTVQNLLARDADIAVRMTRPIQNDIIARKTNDLALGAFAHKDYLAKHAISENPSELSQQTLLGYDRDTLIIDGMKRVGINIKRQDFAIRTDDQIAYWHLLCAGAGIGFASHFLARNNDQLVHIFKEFPIEPLPMWLASHNELKSNLRIRRTMDFLHEALQKMPLNQVF